MVTFIGVTKPSNAVDAREIKIISAFVDVRLE